jgi:hypothetical protein
MRLRVQLSLVGSAGAAIGLSGCASPGDVQARYDTARTAYESDMATAREWDAHVLGIPAAGWVAILITGLVLLAALLATAGFFMHRTRMDRRAREHELAMDRERTVRAAAERGSCPGCGLDVPALMDRIRVGEAKP